MKLLVCILLALAMLGGCTEVGSSLGSTVLADNGRDYSDLESRVKTDDTMIQCDITDNNEPSITRSFNRSGGVIDIVSDPYGGSCSVEAVGHERRRNAYAHDSCIGRYSNGAVFGCGPNSRHPG